MTPCEMIHKKVEPGKWEMGHVHICTKFDLDPKSKVISILENK